METEIDIMKLIIERMPEKNRRTEKNKIIYAKS